MDELDEFFANLEVEAINSKPTEIPSLDTKIINDFHGNIPIFNEEVSGQLPTITKVSIRKYYRFRYIRIKQAIKSRKSRS